MLINMDCLEALKDIETDSIDSLVTDPPAGISFMNKSWDKDKGGRDYWIDWFTLIMFECKRVLKPGAHGFVWALPRTSHWTATALENAGFEIRDIVTHVFGSGFPKSHNIALAIDKKKKAIGNRGKAFRTAGAGDRKDIQNKNGKAGMSYNRPITDQAKQYDGWGTALKPAAESWILIRVPLSEKTIVDNVLKWGVGGINIDACRIETEHKHTRIAKGKNIYGGNSLLESKTNQTTSRDGNPQGRFPANFICSGEARDMLDEQSGSLHLRGNKKDTNCGGGMYGHKSFKGIGHSESGHTGASRFFYCSKSSKRDRNNNGLVDNLHPTCKSTKLMKYLITMVTPLNGTVLDPFMGSGSTGVACQGFNFIGIEKEKDYFEIAQKRIKVNQE